MKILIVSENKLMLIINLFFKNILAGAVFGVWPMGLLLCCLLTAFGASNCFLLSKYAGKDFIKEKFPAQITWLQEKVNLFIAMLIGI